MTGHAAADWTERIVACAQGQHGRARDDTGWDDFYRDYADAGPNRRAQIDAAFVGFGASNDPALIKAVLLHAGVMPARPGLSLLLRLLDERAEFLQACSQPDRNEPLICLLLAAMTSRTVDEAGELAPRVRSALLSWVARVPSLGLSVGTFFGQLGPTAVQALVAHHPAAASLEPLLAEAGYELHRSEAHWAEVRQLSAAWPASLRDALERGAAAHSARFPQGVAPSAE